MASKIANANFAPKNFKPLNYCLKHVRQTAKQGLVQHKLNLTTTRIFCYSDSSFANNPNDNAQLGHCILFVDNTGRTSWLHFYSYNIKRVLHSFLGGETYAFANAFDAAYMILHDISKMIGLPLELTMITDSLSLLQVLFNYSNTTERILMTDIQTSPEAYEKFEIWHVGWVKCTDNLADGLPKPGKCPALEEVLTKGD